MFRSIVLLQFSLLPMTVLSLGSGCTVDAAGKNVCPEDGGDIAALLQSKVTVNASKIETVSDKNKKLMLQHGTVPPECVVVENTDTSDDLIDVDKMIHDFKCQAAMSVIDLQAQVDMLKPAFDASKSTFKSARSTLRTQYRDCKRKIFWNKNKWPSKSECTPFKAHIPCSSRRRNNEPSCIAGQASRRRLKPVCSNKEKCILRQARVVLKREVKDEFLETRDKYRNLKKDLRKAKFQKNLLPKIIKAMKPHLLEALENVDMTEGLEGPLSDVPIDEITVPALLQNFMEVSLNAQLSPKLEELRDKVLKKIWDFVKPLYDAIKSAMQTLVGSIPLIGGVFSVAIGFLIDALYDNLQDGVKDALDKVRKDMQGRLVSAISNAVMATGLFTQEALADPAKNSANLLTSMANAASAAQGAEVQATQATVVSTAAAAKSQAEADAATVNTEVSADANAAAAEDAEEEAEDETFDEDEEKADNDDEED